MAVPPANTCSQNYKFEGKERDTETGNDDFGARYYSNRFGRWLSADWSAVPVAVPYANLTNPQTLNLYAMVADDPESFADLDGHECTTLPPVVNSCASKDNTPPTTGEGSQNNGTGTPPSTTQQAQAAQQFVERSTTVMDGQAYQYERVSVTNADGTTTVTTKTTTVSFSNEPGQEGKYLDSKQYQRVDTIDKEGGYHEGKEVTTTISEDQGRATVGNSAFHTAQTQAAEANRVAYFGRAVKADAKAHPGKYVAATGGILSLALGPAGYPVAAKVATVVGAAGGLYEALTHWHSAP